MIESGKMKWLIAISLVSVLVFSGVACGQAAPTSESTPTATTKPTATPASIPEVVKPKPSVVSVSASTSGIQNAYYAILDITVKNDGAEGTILVIASITQAGTTTQNEMPVYIKNGQSQELKMTFPLVWKGGNWTPSVQAVVP